MSQTATVKRKDTSEEQRVTAYLSDNTDFFNRHPDLLCNLELPHQSGKAVSLVERQVALLRERNIDMRQRLTALLENAHANNELFEHTRQLVLDLLEAASLQELTQALQRSLKDDFKTEFHCLCLLSKPVSGLPASVRCTNVQEAQAAIGNLFDAKKIVCGVLRNEELEFFFGEAASAVGSAAVIPLLTERQFGLLAVGSHDPLHFKSGMGTLFLSHIAEMLCRTVPEHL